MKTKMYKQSYMAFWKDSIRYEHHIHPLYIVWCLTHLPLDKMAGISQTICSDAFSWMKNFVPEGPIDNKSALVQVMTWRRAGDKPLPEPVLAAQFTGAYMQP